MRTASKWLARVVVALSLAAALLSLGCGATVRGIADEAPRAATPAIADSSLKVMEDQATRRRIAAVMATPEVRDALREVSAALVQGAALGLTDEQMSERLTPIMQRITAAVTSTLRDELLGDETIERARVAATSIASSATRAAVGAAAEEIPDKLAPAMERAITERLGPAIESVLRDNVARGAAAALDTVEVREGIGRSARVVSREVVYGSNEALADLEAHQPKKGLLARLAGLGKGVSGLFAAAVVGALAVAIVLFLARFLRHRRSRLA